jgi:hypothetical protein
VTTYRANYALLDIREHLGTDSDDLDVPWATFAGDATSPATFSVPTDDPVDAYVELQAYDVGEYGHEILVNGDALTGFDVPPGTGWEYWMDTITGASLQQGENDLQVVRDTDGEDGFVVGTVTVHWKEPVE